MEYNSWLKGMVGSKLIFELTWAELVQAFNNACFPAADAPFVIRRLGELKDIEVALAARSNAGDGVTYSVSAAGRVTVRAGSKPFITYFYADFDDVMRHLKASREEAKVWIATGKEFTVNVWENGKKTDKTTKVKVNTLTRAERKAANLVE